MTAADWAPDSVLERDLSLARQNGDGAAYVRLLARADLLLPLLPEEAAGDGPVSWVTSDISGTRHVLAFTSTTAMNRLLDDELPHRVARFVELAETWPDPSINLAVDPGLPSEAFLSQEALAEVAELAAEPAPGREQTLLRAIAAGDVQAYALALLEGEVAVPLDPRRGSSRDLTDPEFPWARMEDTGEADGTIVLFSSAERLRDQLGEHPHILVGFARVATAWRDPDTALAVDPGSPIAAVLDGAVVAALGARVEEFERATLDADQDQPAGPGAVAPSATAVQVVVPAGQVDRYLQQGHRRVAGLVHRPPGGAIPLGDLYVRLGLVGEGSPFRPDDDEGYVLRWYEPHPAAYRSPTMDGVELPDGAILLSIDRTGAERPIATYRADRGAWYAVPGNGR